MQQLINALKHNAQDSLEAIRLIESYQESLPGHDLAELKALLAAISVSAEYALSISPTRSPTAT